MRWVHVKLMSTCSMIVSTFWMSGMYSERQLMNCARGFLGSQPEPNDASLCQSAATRRAALAHLTSFCV